MRCKNEIYAGDEAWTHWFKKCAVGRCAVGEQAALKRQIESAFFNEAFNRHGVSRSDYDDEDVCSLFDTHFWLHGNANSKSGRRASKIKKPLKEYLHDRIDISDGESLKKIVCGTFFSSQCGLIKDIVRESVTLVKGWQPRWITLPNGKKKLEWVKPIVKRNNDDGNGEDCIEGRIHTNAPRSQGIKIDGKPYVPIVYDDAYLFFAQKEEEWTPIVNGLLDFLCENMDRSVPILVYAVLHGIKAKSETLQRLADVKAVRLQAKMNLVKEKMARFFRTRNLSVADVPDTVFLSVLRREAAGRIEGSVIKALNNEI